MEAACVTSALVRTSVLRPSQSAQLSEAIIFLRFRSRNACAGRWCLSPAAHTGQPCEDTIQPATSEHTAQSARRCLCNIEHIGDGSIGGHRRKAARQREGKRRAANRRDGAIRKCEQFGTEGLSKGPGWPRSKLVSSVQFYTDSYCLVGAHFLIEPPSQGDRAFNST